MARSTITVCDSCGGNPAPNSVRLTAGARTDSGDLCDACIERLRGEMPGLHKGAKRGRKPS